MDASHLHFFEHPTLPLSLPPPGRSRLPAFTNPPSGDLRWLRVEQWLTAKSLAANTERAYLKELKRFWHWTDKPWNQVTTWDITRYKDDLEKATIEDCSTGQPKPQFSPNSVALAVRSLKSFFGWMQQAHYITDNPTLAVSAPSEPEPESKELSDRQVQALYAALARRGQSRLRDTALLAVLSHGLRAEEASQLNIEDYDGQRLHIRQAKQGSTGRVPLDKDARAAIDTYLAWWQVEGNGLAAEEPLFVNYSRDPHVRGKRLSYDGVYSIVKQLGRVAVEIASERLAEPCDRTEWVEGMDWEIAALLKIHPHQLRHTFASNLVLDGMDAYLAMALTRHRSISVFKRYSSKARERQAERAFLQLRGESWEDE